MTCPRFQQDNPVPNAQFCPRCGAPVKYAEDSHRPAASYGDLLEQQGATGAILRVISQSPTSCRPSCGIRSDESGPPGWPDWPCPGNSLSYMADASGCRANQARDRRSRSRYPRPNGIQLSRWPLVAVVQVRSCHLAAILATMKLTTPLT